MNAICEMTAEELASEYLNCVNAVQDPCLDYDTRHYFRDRAIFLKQYISQVVKGDSHDIGSR